MKPDFIDSIAKIIADVRDRTCIEDVDTDVLEEILKDEFIKYHNEILTYGHSIGYDDGYTASKSILEGDVDSAYREGYASGYEDGYSAGHSAGQSKE